MSSSAAAESKDDAGSSGSGGGAQVSVADQGKRFESAEDCADLCAQIDAVPRGQLRRLVLRGNTFSEQAVHAVALALSRNAGLEYADLSDMFTTRLRPSVVASLKVLSQALLDAHSDTLLELNFSNNAFGPDGANAISPLLQRLPKLTVFRFDNVGLGPEGTEIICDALLANHRALPQGATNPLRTIVMGRNRLEDKGTTALAKALSEIGSVQELHLYQNGMRAKSAEAFSRYLPEFGASLITLNLSDNTTGACLAVAVAGALKNCPLLQKLDLGATLVKPEGASAIARALDVKSGDGACPDLTHLDLSYNEVDDATGKEIAYSLRGKNKLQRLELNGNELNSGPGSALEAIHQVLGELGTADALGSMSDNEDENDPHDDDDGDDSDNESQLNSAMSKLSVK